MAAEARSWQEAKEIAEKEGEELVFHNFETGEYGACSRMKRFGCFRHGEFIEERCICIRKTRTGKKEGNRGPHSSEQSLCTMEPRSRMGAEAFEVSPPFTGARIPEKVQYRLCSSLCSRTLHRELPACHGPTL
jgi:hypothetical protein